MHLPVAICKDVLVHWRWHLRSYFLFGVNITDGCYDDDDVKICKGKTTGGFEREILDSERR